MTALIGHRPSLSLILSSSFRPFIILKVSISAVADIINQPSFSSTRKEGKKEKERKSHLSRELLIMPPPDLITRAPLSFAARLAFSLKIIPSNSLSASFSTLSFEIHFSFSFHRLKSAFFQQRSTAFDHLREKLLRRRVT